MKNANRRKYHFIYKTVCSINGKYYIGMHSTDDMNDGYMGSGKKIQYLLKKYGKENHTLTILEDCSEQGREYLRLRERVWVDETRLTDPLCLNIDLGGKTMLECKATARERLSRSLSKKIWCHDPVTGKHTKCSIETVPAGYIPGRLNAQKTGTKEKLSNVTSGRSWYQNPTTGEKLRLSSTDLIPEGFIKGRGKHSKESRQKRSATMKKILSTPEAKEMIKNRFKGKRWPNSLPFPPSDDL